MFVLIINKNDKKNYLYAKVNQQRGRNNAHFMEP